MRQCGKRIIIMSIIQRRKHATREFRRTGSFAVMII